MAGDYEDQSPPLVRRVQVRSGYIKSGPGLIGVARNLDDTGKHLIRILRQGGAAANEMTQIVLKGRDDTIQKVIELNKRRTTQAQTEALIHQEIGKLQEKSADSLVASGMLAGTFQAESSLQYLLLLGVADPKLYNVTERFVKRTFKVPFPFQNISVDNMLTGTMAALDIHIVNATRQARVTGATLSSLEKFFRLASGSLGDDTLRRKAHALARTAIAQVANAVRHKSFVGEDEVSGVLYVATLDHRTSRVCMSLDGEFFPDKSIAPVPPVHVSCRSTLVPVLQGETLAEVKDQLRRPAVEPKSVKALEEKGLKTRNNRIRFPSSKDSSPLKGVQKQQYLTYEEWLKTQPVLYQREILGTKAFNKFNTSGNLRSALGVLE